MKKKLQNLEDVKTLVRTFYNKVLNDDKIGSYFTFVMNNHWERHLQVLDSFWNDTLFYSNDYKGNPLQVHITLHHFSKLSTSDFERWIKLFTETVDELFEGEKAELAKQRAVSIATIMQIKILHANAGVKDGL